MSSSPAERWAARAPSLAPAAPAYTAIIEAMIEEGDLAAAAHGISAARELYPEDAGVCALVAREAERLGDWPAAIAAWQRVRAGAPADLEVAASLGRAHLRARQHNQAEEVLGAAVRDAAQDGANRALRAVMVEHARAAAARGDFAATRARWQALLALVPEHRVARRQLRDMETLKLPEIRDDAPWLRGPAEERDTTHAALMMRFEGLGGTCEFGLMQRHFGAEPLGLLRWVGLQMSNLLIALADGFEGVGDPRYTRMTITPIGEFITSDTRYGLNMHTFMRNTGQDQDKLIGQLRRRMRFLRDKLLEDLREGEKIFVYRHVKSPPDTEFIKLLTALRAYNPSNRLVAMRMLPHGAPGEPLCVFAPGAASGAVADGRRPGQGQGWAVDNDFWLSVCQKALEILPNE